MKIFQGRNQFQAFPRISRLLSTLNSSQLEWLHRVLICVRRVTDIERVYTNENNLYLEDENHQDD